MVEPNDAEESSALILQLDNSDWSSSPENSNSPMYDDILTPLSQQNSSPICQDDCAVEVDHSAVAEVNNRTNASVTGVSDEPVMDVTDEPVVNEPVADVPEEPVADGSNKSVTNEPVTGVSDEPVENISNEPVTDASTAPNIDNETNQRASITNDNDAVLDRPEVLENGYNNEQELFAKILTDDNSNLAESNSSQDKTDVDAATDFDYVELSSSSPFHLSDDIDDPFDTPKHIEIIAPEETETELDCGVQPLPDLPDPPVEFSSQPSPDPIIPSPPRPTVELTYDSVATAPRVSKKVHKPFDSTSVAPEELAKRGLVIIRHHGKILRKSSRTKKKRTAQLKDSFQDYLEKTFALKSFIIRLDKYKVSNEPNETEKLDFLSNFNLKKKGVFPVYSEHGYTLSKTLKSPRTKRASKTAKSEYPKFRKVDNKSKVMRKKKEQQIHLRRFNFTRAIEAVELERLVDDSDDIREEHSYNFRENDRKLSSDFSLKV